jgi:probable phosphoglycerate mutase
MRLCLVRHLATGWNREKRLQGRSDQPLTDDPPPFTFNPDFTRWKLVSSPLTRAVTTAERLFGRSPELLVDALIEMDWGEFEGRRLPDIRAELGPALAENEAKGLDFRPPGGESPRDVQQRIGDWIADLETDGRDLIAVTHKGVIRAAHALATGWDMKADAPEKIDFRLPQLYRITPERGLAVERLNIRPEDFR